MTDLDLIHWNASLLLPQSTAFNPVPFTRSGGRSLGGISRSTKTDRGFWVGALKNIAFRRAKHFEQEREWNIVRTFAGGQAGLIVVPICSTRLLVDRPSQTDFTPTLLPHDDQTQFEDGTFYYEGAAHIEMAAYAPLGATQVTLRSVSGHPLEGVRFSYQYAMYETGRAIGRPGIDEITVPIFPAIRRAIPAGSWVEADRPTLLCRLASDAEMDLDFPAGNMPRPSVNFIEAVDVWNDLASESPTYEPSLYGSDGLDFRYINNSQYL